MLRITVITQSEQEVVIKVDGRWTEGEEAVALLQNEGEQVLRQGKSLGLELSGIKFIDRTGIYLLKKWSKGRLKLYGGSLFMRTLLETHGLKTTHEGF